MSMSVIEKSLARGAGLGFEAVYFDDDTFTRVPEHAVAISELCRKHGLAFGCHTRPDCESPGLIETLVRNGCVYMFSGLESVVPEILVAANKTHDPVGYREAYETSYRFKRELGLPSSAFLIHGLPRRALREADESSTGSRRLPTYAWAPDRLDDSVTSIEFAVRELDPTYLSMNVLRFIPGVPLSESALFDFLRPVAGPLHGGYFDSKWIAANGVTDPRCFHPILRAFEGAGSPIPPHMTPSRCYQVLRAAVDAVNRKNAESGRAQTHIVVDPWFARRFLTDRVVSGVLTYELAPFDVIDRSARMAPDLRRRGPSESSPRRSLATQKLGAVSGVSR
jgi:hypothetical protein